MELFLKTGELKLMQSLRDIGNEPFGWHAVHFHLSDLMEDYKSEYQVKIAVNLMHDLLKVYEGGIYLMHDQSIMALCFKLEKQVLDKLVFQLRYLYMDDPLAYSDTGQENTAFCTSYELRYQWTEFFAVCSKLMAGSGRKPFPDYKLDIKPEQRLPMGAAVKPYPKLSLDLPQVKEAIINEPFPPSAELLEFLKKPEKPEKAEKKEFSASSLALIENDLSHADLHRAIRRQPVCAVTGDMQVRKVFDELYIHIAHLRQVLHSEVDFLSNRWLFKYLTLTLDERVLSHLRRSQARYLEVPVSLNLNVETLLSDAFAEFDAVLKPQAKVSIVIEVPVIDVFANMAAFARARDEIQKLGYRICLDGLTTDSFTSINREQLGLDLVKVQWNAALQEGADTQALSEAVRVTGSNRIILCHCDSKAAVEYGQKLGISLFQGRYLDGLLNPEARVVN